MSNYTQVTATNIVDAAGNKLANGTISFQAVDASNRLVNFQVGGGGQVVTTPATATIVNGAITGTFQVANPANTIPAGILYQITITDTNLNKQVALYSLVSFSGDSFNLDNYMQSGLAVIPPIGSTVNGPLVVNGNLSVTGTLLSGSPGAGAETKLGTFSIAATTWSLTHSFGTQAVQAQCYDNSFNIIFPDSLQNTNVNTTVATFLEPQVGYMVVVNVGNWTPSVASPNNIIGNPVSSQSIAGDFPLTLGGSLTAPRVNSVRVVDGVKFTTIQAAINDLPSCTLSNDLNSYTNPPSTYNSYTFNHCGEVYIPAGTYTVSSEIDITSPYVKLRGAGNGATVLNWTGTTGCAISWTTSPFVDDWVGAGGLYDLHIDGFNGSAGTCGLKTWDNTGFHMSNVGISNFSGAGSVGWWEFNSAEWNEKYDVQIALKNNTTGWLAQRSATSGGTTLGYGRFEVTCDTFSGQTCLVVDGGSQNAVELSHSVFHLTANLVSNPANATAIRTLNGAQIINNLFDVHIEAPFGMGTGHEINLASGTSFTGVGVIHQDWIGSNVSTGATLGITLGDASNATLGIAGAVINNNVAVYWKDASGAPRVFALKDATNNTYFYGDATNQSITFQPVPGATLFSMSAAGVTLPATKSIAFGVNAGNQPLIVSDTSTPSHMQIRGGSGGGQWWNNSFGSLIGAWDDTGVFSFNKVAINTTGTLTLGSTTFAGLGTPVNGTLLYCSDCTVANPCAGSGTGALAKRINGAWVCN